MQFQSAHGAISGLASHHEVEVYNAVHGGILVYGHSILIALKHVSMDSFFPH
jgi:hypothetical protein